VSEEKIRWRPSIINSYDGYRIGDIDRVTRYSIVPRLDNEDWYVREWSFYEGSRWCRTVSSVECFKDLESAKEYAKYLEANK
jgi:hypothetical protein